MMEQPWTPMPPPVFAVGDRVRFDFPGGRGDGDEPVAPFSGRGEVTIVNQFGAMIRYGEDDDGQDLSVWMPRRTWPKAVHLTCSARHVGGGRT